MTILQLRRVTVPLLLAGALLLGACGSDADGDEPDAVVTLSDSDDVPSEEEMGALELFQSLEDMCVEHAERTGNPTIEGSYFADASVASQNEDGTTVIQDGAGNLLVVDTAEGVVHAVDGADQPLPREYSFGCPEDVFLGTLDEGDPDEAQGPDEAAVAAARTFVDAWNAGDAAAAAAVASPDVIAQLETTYGWDGTTPGRLVFVNFDGSVAADHDACDRCTYYFETALDSYLVGLDGDVIVSLEIGD